MQLQHVMMMAAAAVLACSDGLQVVPDSAKSTALRAPAEARYQPYVEGKTDRFLITETKSDAATKAPTGYEFSTLQEENDVLQEEYEDSESSSADGSEDDERLFGRKKKRKKRKKHRATETPTPTPTATPEGNATATPEPGMTRAPAARTPTPTEDVEGLEAFIAWFDRRFGD
ncbi:hypothetical protein DVH05_001429 [Phytophthora capsici]|nr:hypothetical protein DVH05_001429 [Phytophthora capsici]